MFYKFILHLSLALVSTILLSCNSLSTQNISDISPETDKINELFSESGVENVTISLQTLVERRVRNAAVKVTSPSRQGHGSGTFFTYKGFKLIITALHVVDDMDPNQIIIMGKDNESVESKLIYADPQNDIAIMLTHQRLSSRTPLVLNIQNEPPQAGDILTYTGFPSQHDMLTFQGKIAGFETIDSRANRSAILVHTYGWFGSSGSCLFNERAQLVAILWGVDVEVFVMPQAQEDLIYASPASTIDLHRVLLQACRLESERPVCRRVIERDILQRFGTE